MLTDHAIKILIIICLATIIVLALTITDRWDKLQFSRDFQMGCFQKDGIDWCKYTDKDGKAYCSKELGYKSEEVNCGK